MSAAGIDSIHGLNVAVHVAAGLLAWGWGLWQPLARRRCCPPSAWRLGLAGGRAVCGERPARGLGLRPSPDLVAVSLLVGYHLYGGRRCCRCAQRPGLGGLGWRRCSCWWRSALRWRRALGGACIGELAARAVAASMALIGVYDLVRIASRPRGGASEPGRVRPAAVLDGRRNGRRGWRRSGPPGPVAARCRSACRARSGSGPASRPGKLHGRRRAQPLAGL